MLSWPDRRQKLCALGPIKYRSREADLQTVRRLLTTRVRKERFCEGHLAGLCESGHIVSVLKRLKQLWELGEIKAV